MSTKILIKTVPENGNLLLVLPEFSNQQIEIRISPVTQERVPFSDETAIRQPQQGFAQSVLADAAEDIWNDL
ncbi:hypothetical protein [Methylomonas rhizoryzae]|uniref:hypothetical protein n=1 Tax=Methylomonas rhizoryzae TaxID=2608981 RepID=UPI001231D8A0|nr:hypothetical protein [Methylomonas rhizoryzae]